MWYYSIKGQQQGPVDDIGLDGLVATGVVNAGTYVWKDGMADWAPLSQARSGVLTGGDADTCSLCAKRVGADNLIDLFGNRVCAECKPMAVQSMREGAGLPGRNHTAWRQGKKVVARSQTSLPARCFKCNKEATAHPLSRKIHWHSGWFYLLIVSPLIYVIVAIFVRKRATLDIYLCEQHLQKRKYFMIGGWSGAVLGIGTFCAGCAMNTGWLILLGVAFFIIALFVGIGGAQIARPTRIKNNTVWLGGAGKEFVDSLPPLP